jgi:hypothetical protein
LQSPLQTVTAQLPLLQASSHLKEVVNGLDAGFELKGATLLRSYRLHRTRSLARPVGT